MKYDKFSTRGFMTTFDGKDPDYAFDELKLMPYPSHVVDWMETFNSSTNSWTHALSDTVLESLAFSWPSLPEEQQWRCVSCVPSVSLTDP